MHVTAIIFDWAGTTVDHGSCAPAATLQEVFADAGVPISAAEARQSMGLAKRAHIRALLEIPHVASQWEKAHGAEPTDADAARLYAGFVPRQIACLARHSDVIAGVPEAVAEWRASGIKIGSTTGYTRPMLDFLLTHAAAQGFSPDCAICPEDVPGGGRPAPWMCYLNAIRLETAPLWTMVKIGDTPADVAEGLNAGMWSVGITRTGNEVGWSAGEFDAATNVQRREAVHHAERRLLAAGAHYVAESVAGCLPIVEEIEARLRKGERP